MEKTNFSNYQFQPFIEEAIASLGFKHPTEIQSKMIPTILRGESVIGQSQTGTGKTHAYLLPILQKIDANKKEVQAVITAPTRELANQIYHEIIKITALQKENQIMARCYVGGTDKQRAIDKLKTQPQIIVGTPARINDLVQENALFVHTCNMLVVDEADLMLDMGFILDVDRVASRMPENLQIAVFSATIPEKLKPFLKKYLENPQYEHVQPKHISAEKIEHILVPLKSREKIDLLKEMLVSYNPYLAIVFTNTKQMADKVANQLLEKGLRVARLHGDLTPRDRSKTMKEIRQLKYQYIVATDLAARGIDIEGVSHVINYELPQDLDFYVHRVGRTARGGLSGMAATIYTPSDEDALVKLEKMGITFSYQDIKNNQWSEVTDRNKRRNRTKQTNEIDDKAKSLVRKPKKVKPGYKKKMQWKMDEIKKKERRIKRRNK